MRLAAVLLGRKFQIEGIHSISATLSTRKLCERIVVHGVWTTDLISRPLQNRRKGQDPQDYRANPDCSRQSPSSSLSDPTTLSIFVEISCARSGISRPDDSTLVHDKERSVSGLLSGSSSIPIIRQMQSPLCSTSSSVPSRMSKPLTELEAAILNDFWDEIEVHDPSYLPERVE